MLRARLDLARRALDGAERDFLVVRAASGDACAPVVAFLVALAEPLVLALPAGECHVGRRLDPARLASSMESAAWQVRCDGDRATVADALTTNGAWLVPGEELASLDLPRVAALSVVGPDARPAGAIALEHPNVTRARLGGDARAIAYPLREGDVLVAYRAFAFGWRAAR